MTPASFQRAFGSTVITEPDQPTPLNPAWESLEAHALKRRTFAIRMSGIPLGTGRIVLADITSPVKVTGVRGKNLRVLRFALQGSECDLTIDGRRPGDKVALMMPTRSETTFKVAHSASLHFHVPASKLDRAAGWNDTARQIPDVEIPDHEGTSLRDLTFVACRQLAHLSDDLRATFTRNFENLLAVRWGAAILAQLPDLRRPDAMIGRRKVADLCEWAALDHDDPITVGDLAARCGLGLRALQKNFLRHFDTTPQVFLRNLRLDKVRRLLQDTSARWTVTAAAMDAGFTHLGHFSCSYRERFGELPLATLARTRMSLGDI